MLHTVYQATLKKSYIKKGFQWLVFSNKSPRHVAWLWEISLNPDYTEGTCSNYYIKCLNIIIMYYHYHIKEKEWYVACSPKSKSNLYKGHKLQRMTITVAK